MAEPRWRSHDGGALAGSQRHITRNLEDDRSHIKAYPVLVVMTSLSVVLSDQLFRFRLAFHRGIIVVSRSHVE